MTALVQHGQQTPQFSLRPVRQTDLDITTPERDARSTVTDLPPRGDREHERGSTPAVAGHELPGICSRTAPAARSSMG